MVTWKVRKSTVNKGKHPIHVSIVSWSRPKSTSFLHYYQIFRRNNWKKWFTTSKNWLRCKKSVDVWNHLNWTCQRGIDGAANEHIRFLNPTNQICLLHYGRLVQLLKHRYQCGKYGVDSRAGQIRHSVANDFHRGDVSAELCWPGIKPQRRVPPLVTRICAHREWNDDFFWCNKFGRLCRYILIWSIFQSFLQHKRRLFPNRQLFSRCHQSCQKSTAEPVELSNSPYLFHQVAFYLLQMHAYLIDTRRKSRALLEVVWRKEELAIHQSYLHEMKIDFTINIRIRLAYSLKKEKYSCSKFSKLDVSTT